MVGIGGGWSGHMLGDGGKKSASLGVKKAVLGNIKMKNSGHRGAGNRKI